ncbi:MAG: PDZ domain-containing protein [Rhodobacter sp.]|nr:PDZ domain-containing protein [Rhodobacter sp.]
MRLVSGLLSVIAVASFGFACGALALAFVVPEAAPYTPPARAAALQAQPGTGPDLPETWPAVFGVVPPPAPEPEPLPEPLAEPEVVEEPLEENTSYYLTGLVAGRGSGSWAMISENDRGVVVRVGDTLIGGETVTAIDASGVWIDHDGSRQLIPVQKSDLGGLMRAGPASVAVLAQSDLLAEVTIPVEALDRGYIESALAEAGELSARGNDGGGMDIVSVRRGNMFEQMGLRPGDTILAVNGKTLETSDLLADTPDDEVSGGSLQLEILREGTRHMLKVNLDKG